MVPELTVGVWGPLMLEKRVQVCGCASTYLNATGTLFVGDLVNSVRDLLHRGVLPGSHSYVCAVLFGFGKNEGGLQCRVFPIKGTSLTDWTVSSAEMALPISVQVCTEYYPAPSGPLGLHPAH